MEIYILLVMILSLDYSDSLQVNESLDTCEIAFAKEPTSDIFDEMEKMDWVKVEMVGSL